MTPQELILAIRHLLMQVDDEHNGVETYLKGIADDVKAKVKLADANLHDMSQQITERLHQLQELIGPD